MEFDSGQPRKNITVDTAGPESLTPGPDWDEKIEDLLRQGQELSRAGRYQQAIHVWTRILFLDRGNPVAREAIDRAKRSMAERQRELDAMVAEASDLAQEGERRPAKQLLARVLTLDPRHTEGRSLWEKIEALERRGDLQNGASTLTAAPAGESLPLRRRAKGQASVAKPRRTRSASALKMAAFLFCAFCLLALGGLYLHLNWDFLVSDSAFATTRAAGPGLPAERLHPRLPMPSDLHYYNGARLYAKSRYREALAELARVDRGSACFEEARSLILRIEERLLRETIPNPSSSPVEPSGGKR